MKHNKMAKLILAIFTCFSIIVSFPYCSWAERPPEYYDCSSEQANAGTKDTSEVGSQNSNAEGAFSVENDSEHAILDDDTDNHLPDDSSLNIEESELLSNEIDEIIIGEVFEQYSDYFSQEHDLSDLTNKDLATKCLLDEKNDLYVIQDNKLVLLDSNVSYKWLSDDILFYIVGNRTVFLYDYLIDKKTDLYTSSENNVSNVYGNRDVLFFVEGTTVKRLHIPTNVVDSVGQVNGKVVFFEAETSNKVVLSILGPSFVDCDNILIPSKEVFYQLECSSGLLTEMPPDYDPYIGRGIMQSYDSTYVVNGCTLPFGIYTIGRHFNSSNTDLSIPSTDCTHHSSGCSLDGACGCTSYYLAIQCHGFARFIFNYIWGFDFDADQALAFDRQLSSSEWAAVSPGTCVRSEGHPGHSWIVLENANNVITLYEANNPRGTCKIAIRSFNYANNPGCMGTVYYYTNPSVQHPHSWSTSWYYNSDGHFKVCTWPGCTATTTPENHSFGAYINDGQSHHRSCTVCGMMTSPESHTYNSHYESVDSSTHKAYCVCNAFATINHSYTYTNVNNTIHQIACSLCSYSEYKAHSKYVNYTSSENHYLSCDKNCGYSEVQAHTKSYSSNNSGTHNVSCTYNLCNWSTTETHSIQYVYLNSSQHNKKCTKCSWQISQSHTKTWSHTNTNHTWACSVCGSSSTQAHSGWGYGSWINVATSSVCRRRTANCGTVGCGYSKWDYDYTHDYAFLTKKCKKCGYKKN